VPRAKSEVTGGPIIGVRVTQEEHEVYKKLGGGRWLRAYLRDTAGGKAEDAQPSKADTAATKRVVAVHSAQPKDVPFHKRAHRPFG